MKGATIKRGRERRREKRQKEEGGIELGGGGRAGGRAGAGWLAGERGRQPLVFPQLPPEASSERACLVRYPGRSFGSLRGARRGECPSSTRVSVTEPQQWWWCVLVRVACLLSLPACACAQVRGGKVCQKGCKESPVSVLHHIPRRLTQLRRPVLLLYYFPPLSF